MAEITVRLLAGDDGEKSRKMLRDFSSDIARLEGVKPSTDAATSREPVTLGAIALAAVSSGALTALVQTIGNYLNRDRRNEIEFWIVDGEKNSNFFNSQSHRTRRDNSSIASSSGQPTNTGQSARTQDRYTGRQ